MSGSSWLHNTRGEWYVVAQAVFLPAALLAPILDARVRDQSVSWPAFTVALGGLLCAVGVVIVVLGSIALGRRNVSPFPRPKEGGGLVETGIFSVVRHPIYSGFTFFGFGWGFAWNSLAALIAALALLVFFDIKARREEHWLEAKFGGYAAYKERVKKLIPFVY
jgi:protein-S-isoprenylcysteine O-methyltransferase Ste14